MISITGKINFGSDTILLTAPKKITKAVMLRTDFIADSAESAMALPKDGD